MVNKKNIPTFFEIVTVMAFQYFYDKKVDYSVIEVGLGGRFDATNIVIPMVSVITNVSLEHQDRLGKTIKEIAYEKAGIIKENIPVLTGSEGISLKVIEKIAGEKKAPLTIIKSGSWEKTGGGVDWQSFTIHGKFKDYYIKTHLPGLFQAENLSLALGCIEVIQMSGVYITDENIIEGIKQTKNPGRMEIISFEPLILLDGAHNIASMNMLKNIIVKDFAYDRLILIIGILSDKNIKEMIEIISPLADFVIITKSSNSRACEPEKLKDFFYKDKIVITNSVSEAVEHAKKIANKQDMVLITGSLFTVGEARDILI
jgi:dihydrofolate synthase/folylpolyglutamate synthase